MDELCRAWSFGGSKLKRQLSARARAKALVYFRAHTGISIFCPGENGQFVSYTFRCAKRRVEMGSETLNFPAIAGLKSWPGETKYTSHFFTRLRGIPYGLPSYSEW